MREASASEPSMKCRKRIGLALSGVAFAQQKSAKEEIVGAWTLVSVTSEMDDGNKGEPFGPSPKGVIIFSNDGHFSLFQSRAEIPKIAANDRAKATPEEAQSIVASSIASYGTYSIDEKDKGDVGAESILEGSKSPRACPTKTISRCHLIHHR